ncbi:MAG: GntR family transcriptional regulator [Lautropia sp.]
MSGPRTTRRATAAKAAIKLVPPASGRIDVVLLLRQRIANHDLPPGSKLKEIDLANEFGVPRPRIREALSALEGRGLVERIPNKGAIVTRLDLAQVLEIYEAREALEGLCVRLATERSTPDRWNELHRLFGEPMLGFLQAGDFDASLAGYEQFRREVCAAAQNEIVQQMLDSILERTQIIVRRTIILPGRAELGLQEHRATLEAMRRGDAAEAERMRRQNLRGAADCVRRYHKFVI